MIVLGRQCFNLCKVIVECLATSPKTCQQRANNVPTPCPQFTDTVPKPCPSTCQQRANNVPTSCPLCTRSHPRRAQTVLNNVPNHTSHTHFHHRICLHAYLLTHLPSATQSPHIQRHTNPTMDVHTRSHYLSHCVLLRQARQAI